MNPSQSDALRFSENLPFYVNGSLPIQEKVWMDACLVQHPQWQTDVELARQERIDSQSLRSDLPEAVRLSRLQRQLAWSDSVVQPQPPKHKYASTVVTHPWLIGLFGVLLGGFLVAALGSFVPNFNQSPYAAQEMAMHRGERRDCVGALDIRITLSSSTQWAELAQLLLRLQLQLVHGPNQDGEVWVRINKGASMTETLSLLRNHPAIEQALPASKQALTDPCQP